MICKKCGAEVADGVRFCTVCGAPMLEEKQDQTFTQAYQQTPVILSEKPVKKKKFASVLGVIAGCVSVLMSVIVFLKATGGYEWSETYGGDAYTGIQNAAAQTANNITYLNEIVKVVGGGLLLVLGLALIAYFSNEISKEKRNSQ